MKTISIIADLTYDDEIMHGNDNDSIAFFTELLLQDELLLHSNEIGDTVGTVKIVEIKAANICKRGDV